MASSSASTTTTTTPVEEIQEESLIHGEEIHAHAEVLLENLSTLQELIHEYSQTKNEWLMKIFKSFARYYPNPFSCKLAKILELQPSLQIRTQAVNLLLITLPEGINKPMNYSFLIGLKNPILNSFKIESDESLFHSLCKLIGQLAERLYRYSGWDELLQYCITCITGDSKSNHKKGLMMLSELPVDVTQNIEFWINQGSFDLVFENILKLVNSTDEEVKALSYSAAISLMLLSTDLGRTDVCDILLPMLLNLIDQHGEEEALVYNLKLLVDLVSLDDGNIFKGKHREVFWCIIRVAEIEDASEELIYEAVNIIKEFDRQNVNAMENVVKSFSHEDMRRVVAVAMSLMAWVVDDPLWYDVDNNNCRTAGFTEIFEHGQFLLNCLCLDGVDSVFIPTAIEMIKLTYESDIDWRLRHAAMFSLASITEKNFNGVDMIHHFREVAMLVLKSLDELNPHPRVIWATLHAIKPMSKYKQLMMDNQYDQYEKKLLKKLVSIIICNPCARVQAYAIIIISFLVTIKEDFIIPGLNNNDLAVACLARLPRVDFFNLLSVSKTWNSIVSGNYLSSQRKVAGLTEDWLYMIVKDDTSGVNSLHTFDAINKVWIHLSPLPGEFLKATDFGVEVVSGYRLYLFGGYRYGLDGQMKSLVYYCARSNKWYKGEDMPHESNTLQFGSCVLNNSIYVVDSGWSVDDTKVISCQIYDPKEDKWNSFSNIGMTMGPSFYGFTDKGVWYLRGSTPQLAWETYTPDTDTWYSVGKDNNMVDGWSVSNSTVLNGKLFTLEYCHDDEGGNVTSGEKWSMLIYNRDMNQWEPFMDFRMNGLEEINALIPLNGELCVYHNLGISFINIPTRSIRDCIISEEILPGEVISVLVMEV